MKQIFSLFFLCSTTIYASILVDILDSALKNNHNMKVAQARLNYEHASSYYENERSNVKFIADGFARYYTPQESGLVHPHYNLPSSAVYEHFTKANLNITLSKDIYSPKTIALQALGKEKVKKASYAFNENKNMLILDIVHEYIRLLKRYDALHLSQERYFLSNKELEEAVAKEEVGKLDKVELQLLESKNLEFKVMQRVHLDQFDNALNGFELLTKKPLEGLKFLKQAINYRAKNIPPLSFYQQSLLSKNPKLLESEEDIAIAHKNIAVIQAKYNPSLTAQAGYEYTQNYTPIVLGRTYESGAFVGISTMIPIYTGGRYEAETQKGMMAVREKEEKKEQEASKLLLSLKKEYRLYNSIVLEIEVARQHLETLSLLDKQASIKTQEGMMFPIEKAKIEYQYKEAQNYLKQLEYNYFLADTNIKYLAGMLCREDLMLFESQLRENIFSIKKLRER